MRIKNYGLILFFLSCFVSLWGQSEKTKHALPDYKMMSLNVSFFGENIFHPGFKVGLQYPLQAHQVLKTKKNGKTKQRVWAWFTAANLGLYRHKENHTGLFLNGEIGRRFITNKAKKIELSLGLGYLQTFLEGETFTVDDNGAVESKGITGQGGFMPSLGLGWGKDLYVKNKSPWAWHVKMQYFLQVPYNTALLLRTALEVGVTRRINFKKALNKSAILYG